MAVISNGTTIIDAGALGGSIATGTMKLLQTLTASSSAGVSFTSNIDSTYKKYEIHFTDVHGSNDDENLQFNMTTDGTNWNVTKTTTYFVAYHNEAGNDTSLGYFASEDLAQSTAVQIIGRTVGNDNDQSCTGEIFLFSPSSTTFVKHFLIRSSVTEHGNYYVDYHIAGYCNVTAAIDGVQFSFSTGNIDSGTIKLYGIKDS